MVGDCCYNNRADYHGSNSFSALSLLDRWDEKLKTAGFHGVDSTVPDAPEPFHLSTVMLARPRQGYKNGRPKDVTILYASDRGSGLTNLTELLQSHGFRTPCCTIDSVPVNRDILVLLDESKPFFENIDELSFHKFKDLVEQICSSGSGIFWVTKPTQTLCQDPRYAPVVGLSRTLLVDVFHKFHDRKPDVNPEFEYSIINGLTRVNRIFPCSVDEENKNARSSDHEGAAMKISRQGRLESLHWVARPLLSLEKNELEIEVRAVGLNFRDVLEAQGSIECADTGRIAAVEASGIVRRIGHDVTRFQVGDRVVAIRSGACSTKIVTTEVLCEKIPDDISFADGASMPIVFATAIYALINIGRLQKGQSDLIHSGCGGVDLASIQIAQMLGAKIYTTRCVANFGTMVEIGKIDLLGAGKLDMDVFLANRSYCCFDLHQLIEERPKIVSSLLHSTMVYYQQGFIRPIGLAKVVPGSNAQSYQDMLRYMQQGNHIGKIVMSMFSQDGLPALQEIPNAHQHTAKLDPSASYLLVGGLGGLGRSVSVWMVQHGARNLTFLSCNLGRSSAEESSFVRMLASMGCTAHLVRGSVTEHADVTRAIDESRKPLKGVIHMAMVLQDQSFRRMTLDNWNSATGPKIEGTWNLHMVTQEKQLELDFFILFSSLSGVLGQPGQANYAAANTFLDAFAQYRTGMGLPCITLDIGAMEGVGYLSENKALLDKMRGMGWQTVKEEQLLEALNWAMMPQCASTMQPQTQGDYPQLHLVNQNCMLIGVSPDKSSNTYDKSMRLQSDVRLTAYLTIGRNQTVGTSDNSSDSLRRFLDEARNTPGSFTAPETAVRFAREISMKLSSLLLKQEEEPNIALSLAELGLDSLIAVELRAWCKRVFAMDISVLEMLATGTLEMLGKKIAERLSDTYGA
ncbi:KR domain-containing protein [Camillea tinctor]|nr:KR domain-containing protein [Camillea tinctor]